MESASCLELGHVRRALHTSRQALTHALKAYAVSLIFQFAVAALITFVDGDVWIRSGEVGDHAIDEISYMVVLTWLGGSYGDFYPRGPPARFLACILSMCGYTFQLYLLLLVVQAAVDMAAQRPIPTPTVEKFQKLIPLYLIFTCSLPLFALLLYSFEDFGAHYVNQDDPDMNGEQCETSCQLQLSMYLSWMTFHGTTYGEVLPFSTGGRAVCCTLMAMNYFLTVIWAALAASPVQGGVMGNAGLMQDVARFSSPDALGIEPP